MDEARRHDAAQLYAAHHDELIRPVHDRMPVILDTDAALQWLACTPETGAHCLNLLKPFPAEEMTRSFPARQQRQNRLAPMREADSGAI
jgi:putative SOS response-associated peptidase YedK